VVYLDLIPTRRTSFRMNVFGGKKKKAKAAEVGLDLINACATEPQDFVKILQLVESYPKALEFKDEEGRTALHWCCSRRAKLEIVQFVGNANAHLLKEPTHDGMLPLHYACREQAPSDVIQYLLKGYPQALSKEASGWYPLHYACAKIKSAELVLFILNSYPEVVKKKTQEGRLPIHYASAHQGSIELIARLVALAPETVRQGDNNEWTALHIAAAYNASLSVIEFLIQQYKPGIQKRGHHGRMPLHIACFMKRSLDIIKHLTKQWPMGIKQMDESRMLPLHTACLAGCSIEIIKFLIREWPQSAMQLGKSSWEIAMYALQKQNASQTAVEEFVKWLDKRVDGLGGKSSGGHSSQESSEELRLESAGSKQKRLTHQSSSSNDSFDSTEGTGRKAKSKSKSKRSGKKKVQDQEKKEEAIPPEVIQFVGESLHQACEYPQSLEEIKNVVESCPPAAECPTHNGNLPLHTACLNKADKAVIQFLTEKYPAALQRTDDGGNLPLHLACYSSSSYKSIEYLVEEWPESLFRENNDKETPVARARQPFYEQPNEDVIGMLENLASKIDPGCHRISALDNYDTSNFGQSTMSDWTGENELEEDRKPAARQLDIEDELELPSTPQSSFYQAAMDSAHDGSLTGLDGTLPDSFECFNAVENLPRRGPKSLEEDRKPAARQPDIKEELELPSGAQSSFYQAAVAAARDEGSANESVPPQKKKPGIQYVEEPAVNVDSVMYQMEYRDYPTPNRARGLQDDTDLGNSFLRGAASMAVADSTTAVQKVTTDKTRFHPPELSSFYQDALSTRTTSDAISERGLQDDTDLGDSFLHGAASMAVADSTTTVQMVSTDETQTRRHPPELSSFYQSFYQRPPDAISPDPVVRAQNSTAQKKPGVQYVEEPAVNVDSVMYQMEYGDYPRPNQR
jgi:ankyrin repeat protein